MISGYTDEQFIAIWMEHLSASKVAQEMGIDVRKVYEKRAMIQESTGTVLPSNSAIGKYKIVIPPNKMRINVDMSDGAFIVFSDAHFWPDVESIAFRGLVKLIGDIKPKMIIANGDIFDGAMISRHPRIGYERKPTVKEELAAVQEALTEIENACKGHGTRLLRTIGNHDIRFDSKLSNDSPEYEGVSGMCLDDHLPFWKSAWSVMINEGTTHPVMVKHRWHNGIHATYNNALKGGVSIFTGHLHALGMTRYSDYRGTRYGVDTGTLSDPWGPQFHYMEDNSRNWRSGFAVGTIHDSVLMPPEFCEVINDHEVWWRGKAIEVY